MTRVLALLLALTVPAVGHSWYPAYCCHDEDCRPVPCEDISETPDGFVYDGVKFAKSAEKPSEDRRCHVCIYGKGSGRTGLCLFTLQGT